jgi:hypothetical protein
VVESDGFENRCVADITADSIKTSGDCQERLSALLAQIDPKLAELVNAWPDLPAHIRAAVLALVGTAEGASND